MTITWKFENIKVFDSGEYNNIIESFVWEITATEGDVSSSFSSTFYTSCESDSYDNFISIADITKDILKNWVESAYGAELENIQIRLIKEASKKLAEQTKRTLDLVL